MKPRINDTRFGSITVEGTPYKHDIYIGTNGVIRKRRKKLSKAVYGTSHKISKEEIKFIFEKGADTIIIGTGQFGRVELSDEAKRYLEKNNCTAQLLPTPKAIKQWNYSKKKVIGLFHVTC